MCPHPVNTENVVVIPEQDTCDLQPPFVAVVEFEAGAPLPDHHAKRMLSRMQTAQARSKQIYVIVSKI